MSQIGEQPEGTGESRRRSTDHSGLATQAPNILFTLFSFLFFDAQQQLACSGTVFNMAGKIRQPIDLDKLQKYIEENVPEIKTPFDVKQFGFGQSNPTYQLTSPNRTKYVLRKKPPGKLLSKTAHQVEREYKIIHALENTDVPVPKTYCLCEDDSVIGTPFYIMEFLVGRIITENHLPDVSPEIRKEMWHDAVRTLAKFHSVDPKKVGLERFGRSSGFYDRQLKTFGTLSVSQANAVDVETKQPVGKIPHFDEMVKYFKRKEFQPEDRTTLIHGDYKIDNLVFHKTEPRVIGILDWEMATIGHPLSDFVNLTGPYSWMNTRTVNPNGRYTPEFEPNTTPGLPTLETCMKWYAEVSGYDPTPELTWGNAFGGFRAAIIMQGIAARYALRQASSERAKEYGQQLTPYGEWAWSKIEEAREIDEQKLSEKRKTSKL